MVKHMPFVKDDGGRAAAGYIGTAGDCVVRSVAIATEQPYQQVYEALSAGMRAQRNTKRKKPSASARNGVHTNTKWFKEYMASLGWRWTPTMHAGVGCTVHLVDGELPPGRLVVAVSKHYTAVIDGVIHDMHDPAADRGTTIYPVGAVNVPKNAVPLPNGGGWAYKPERCVYGYWQKAAPLDTAF